MDTTTSTVHFADMTPDERARLRAEVIRRISEAEAELEGGEQGNAWAE